MQLCFIGLLIVQIELTIVYNGISGLQSFSNLGQMIPFIIGLGGFVKVLWGKGCLIWEGKAEEEPETLEKLGEYERAMAKYIADRVRLERKPTLIRVATA